MINQLVFHHAGIQPIKKTPFDCETDDVDHELLLGANYPSKSKSDDASGFFSIFAPLLHHDFLNWLEKDSEVLTIAEVKEMDPCLAYCICKAIPYSLSSNGDMNIRPHLQNIVRRLMFCDKACFPKTYNLRVVWRNVTNIVRQMEKDSHPFLVRAPDTLPGIRQYRVPIQNCHKIKLAFTGCHHKNILDLSTAVTLIGFAHDGRYVGLRAAHYLVKVHALRGLRFLKGKSGGITALKLKDGREWTRWYGKIERGAKDEKHEWDECEKEFILLYDVGHFIFTILPALTDMSRRSITKYQDSHSRDVLVSRNDQCGLGEQTYNYVFSTYLQSSQVQLNVWIIRVFIWLIVSHLYIISKSQVLL
jgi:hypothetical protein